MGAWDVGPFDNDMAADFVVALDRAPAGARAGKVRAALVTTVENGEYLDSHEACEAVAAAALIVEQLPGATALPGEERPYRPSEPLPDLTGLRELAVRALDRVVAGDSELRELWDESDGEEWLADIAALRAALVAR
ncbi:DUF4259 domain-containing protein [Streptomyces sedi]|uniref:DUF4259 domain-containing protein n=1 Tax=Streptomyces sedi TaxID=555059 RepID=A0A5C4V128_9ACTN|nr:DUF4259 domain-containing protein [Streptomyces sedi]TNM29435.1 DUF4259 domain-containing protein [Streptomyces sedi]